MKRCTLVIPDAGPFNSLWVADELDLLLRLDMPIVVVDAVYDELTSDLSYPKDRDVKAFIDGNRPPFTVASTDIGRGERAKRDRGEKPKKHAGELAMLDFVKSDDGLPTYVARGEPVLLLFEDAGVRVFNKPPNVHLLSTVALLRGLERAGIIASANAILHEMTHPTRIDRRPSDARSLTDSPDGVDEPAAVGSTWMPPGPC
jgi:hypothetical protein